MHYGRIQTIDTKMSSQVLNREPQTVTYFSEEGTIMMSDRPDDVPPPLPPPPSTHYFARGTSMRQCNCCPYGYHIDLDFVRYCEQLATNVQQLSDEQLLRRNKRRQRKSMDVMLGFNEALLDFELDLMQHQNSTKSTTTTTKTTEEMCGILYEVRHFN